ncbi:Aspartic proteinase-like protein 1 [Morella rubra]|uniref:Aspartic proteinase-like protein 1 n=1 Tax=Morella rubra TaxID=262757 RepID=A0A6A1UHB7_9ROSI|nr:Aspartic proteinase-like protein 1 [Morella rubra]
MGLEYFMDKRSVPSVPNTLARNRLASNSFSMCFGPDGAGRISFGNKGSSDQRETPFTIGQDPSPGAYNISITHITLGNNTSSDQQEFSAMFDSFAAITHLTQATYDFISQSTETSYQCLGILRSATNLNIIGREYICL